MLTVDMLHTKLLYNKVSSRHIGRLHVYMPKPAVEFAHAVCVSASVTLCKL